VSNSNPHLIRRLRNSSRRLTAGAAAALLVSCCALQLKPPREAPGRHPPRRLLAPDLAAPLFETLPPAGSQPDDPVKAVIFERINSDRAAAGLLPVAWDGAASRVADAFCAQQVREATRGHFLMDGIPPYARTSFAGVFGAQSENSVSWVTSGRSFSEPPAWLALTGHEDMMSEKPPGDGHRRTILDPEATHVGVGYAVDGGRFQMAQEFLTRGLERLSIVRIESSRPALRFDGKPLPSSRLQFVTIARESSPAPLTREEATARTSYSYPRATLAYTPEGGPMVRVSGTDTQNRIRVGHKWDFTFTFAPDRPGLYTFVFYTAARVSEPARPGASATIWVE
jgi:hypothetical protein